MKSKIINMADKTSDAVDRLLASPRYGERWARHWLDVVHYGDTHGYDKDKLRPNAWPYRDYVIRSLNADKPYGRFVKEQVAADVLYHDQPHLIPATGFIAAGPWDHIGHVEVPAAKIDGRVARPISHPPYVNCTQCHVEAQSARLEAREPAENAFVGLNAALRGERAWLDAPPVIPHSTWMRDTCLACHGPRGRPALMTTHPERQSCTQCHAPSADHDQRWMAPGPMRRAEEL